MNYIFLVLLSVKPTKVRSYKCIWWLREKKRRKKLSTQSCQNNNKLATNIKLSKKIKFDQGPFKIDGFGAQSLKDRFTLSSLRVLYVF